MCCKCAGNTNKFSVLITLVPWQFVPELCWKRDKLRLKGFVSRTKVGLETSRNFTLKVFGTPLAVKFPNPDC